MLSSRKPNVTPYKPGITNPVNESVLQSFIKGASMQGSNYHPSPQNVGMAYSQPTIRGISISPNQKIQSDPYGQSQAGTYRQRSQSPINSPSQVNHMNAPVSQLRIDGANPRAAMSREYSRLNTQQSEETVYQSSP